MEGTRRKWVGVVAGIVVLVLVLVGLASRDEAPEVQTALVTRESVSASITSNGKVEPVQPFIMRAALATSVQQVNAAEGQAVRRGQVILTLDATDARAQLSQARAELVTAQEDLGAARAGGPPAEVAQIEGDLRKARVEVASLERSRETLKKLVADHAATQDELDQNQIALERAQADLQTLQKRRDDLASRSGLDVQRDELRVQQARDQVQALEEKVNSSRVVSPVDGTLYSLTMRAGDYVKVGDILAEMADLRHVRVRAFVDEPDLGWLEPNQVVEVTWDAMPSRLWTGRTEQIPKQVVPHQVRSVGEVLCSVDNSKLDLLPNINVGVRIRVRERLGALVVPRTAVRSDGPHHYVFFVDGTRLRQREIMVGVSSATRYEVLSGLSQGDRVALPGDFELRDGMGVRPLEPKAETN